MIYFINSKKYTNGPPFYAAKKELDKVNFKYELIKEDKTTTIKYNEIDLIVHKGMMAREKILKS